MSAPGSKPSAKEWTLFVCPQCGITHLELEAFRHGHCAYCCARAERVRVAPVDELLRCAQALRLIRDSTSGYSANVARRALEEAGIDDPPEGVLGCSGRPEKETG